MGSCLLAVCCLIACGDNEPVSQPSADLDIGRRFVADADFRRSSLETSLAVADNGDARLRLARYARPGEWEDLPVLDVEIAPIFAGAAPVFERLDPAEIEWGSEALIALGRLAFEAWPAQRAPSLTPLLGSPTGTPDPERLATSGAWRDDRDRLGGFVWARYADGTAEPALSCASCHARPDSAGRLIHGAASDFDWGALVGEAWGPGRVDVTSDGMNNPVAIPDLRATRHQRRLHHTGNLYNSVAALAVRTETLLITARAEAVRPPREIAFALAYYVWSLGGDTAPTTEVPSRAFREHCGSCHFDPTGAGDVVPLAVVGIDGAAARSPMRGSAGYRAPSLYRVTLRARLTHEGWPLTLAQFLDPERTALYPGHAFGLELGAEERAELVRELSQR